MMENRPESIGYYFHHFSLKDTGRWTLHSTKKRAFDWGRAIEEEEVWFAHQGKLEASLEAMVCSHLIRSWGSRESALGGSPSKHACSCWPPHPSQCSLFTPSPLHWAPPSSTWQFNKYPVGACWGLLMDDGSRTSGRRSVSEMTQPSLGELWTTACWYGCWGA